MIGLKNLTQQHPAVIVAEIGQAHDGSLGILHSYIDALAGTGANAVKFQVHIAEAESSRDEPFRVKFAVQDLTRFEYWKRMEIKKEDWASIKSHCEGVGLEFVATPFSVAATHLLSEIGCETFKIGSGDVNNLLLLHHVRNVALEVIFSTGLASASEVRQTLSFFKERGVPTAALKCTTMYPTPPSKMDLSGLKRMVSDLECPVGLSDHSGSIYGGIAAMALGAKIIEAHVVFDKRMFGPDSSSSLTINDFEKLAEARDFIAQASQQLNSQSDDQEWKRLRDLFGRTLSLTRDLNAGDSIGFDDLETTKPAGQGIAPEDFEMVVGKKLVSNRSKGDFLRWKDLEVD